MRESPFGNCRMGSLLVGCGEPFAARYYGEVSEVLAFEKTLVMLPPSVVMMTMETIEIRTMISAYSTRPWPLPVFTASMFR